jgi:predicted ATPase
MLERGAALSAAHPKRAAIHRFGQDPGVSCLSYSAWALFGLGFPDRAASQCQAALALAESLDHPISLAAARVYAAIDHQFRRAVAAARAEAERAIQVSEAHGFPQFLTVGRILRGWALAHEGSPEAGLAMMQDGLAERRAQGIELARPWYLALIADATLVAGEPAVGLAAVDEARRLPDRGFFLPELHRLAGELMLSQGNAAAGRAEACFQQALDQARADGTRGWALRAVLSLGRLWASQGKRRAAMDLVGAVLEGFEEGQDTLDLVDARRLLEDLRR